MSETEKDHEAMVRCYRKKPMVVQAIHWLGYNWDAVCDFMPVPERAVGDSSSCDSSGRMSIVIPALEGHMRAEIGDWIIKGIAGEFYPCKDEIFRATYEFVLQETDRRSEREK